MNIKATDKAASEEDRRSSLTLLTVQVTDSDDQGPKMKIDFSGKDYKCGNHLFNPF